MANARSLIRPYHVLKESVSVFCQGAEAEDTASSYVDRSSKAFKINGPQVVKTHDGVYKVNLLSSLSLGI